MSDRHRPSKFANSSIFAIVAAGAIPLSGCATVKSGDYGVALDDTGHPRSPAANTERLKISAGEHGSLSSPYFGVVEVTFENNTPAWIQIDHIDLDFGTADKNKSVLIPWGDDIDTWEQATLQRNAIRAANTQTALGLIAIAGAVAGSAAGRHSAAGAIGGTVALGALAGLYAQERNAAVEATRDPSRFPPTHLLTMPLRIPPGLFAKRWLLLYTAAQPLGGCIDSFILSYETAEHERGRVLLKFKEIYNSSADGAGSEWQVNACSPPQGAMGRT